MGLFSKKTYTCKQCGKEYEARMDLGGGLCSECQKKLKEMEKNVSGYVAYAEIMGKSYDWDELKAVALHRDGILEKYRIPDSMTKEEMKAAGDNYKKLSEDEAMSIYNKSTLQSIFDFPDVYFTCNFIGLTGCEGVVVDAEDIFAVANTSIRLSKDTITETILSVVFTNDPYIPVFGVLTSGKVGLFAFRSKSARNSVETIFSRLCPNLAYPVMELKKLKKLIKAEGCKGNISTEDMLEYISDASGVRGIFKRACMPNTMLEADLNRLYSYGYILHADIEKLLKMDKIFAGSFWKDIAEKCN